MKQYSGDQTGPVQQLDVFPETFPHRRHEPGGDTGYKSIEEMQAGAGHRGDDKENQFRFIQARHETHFLSVYIS